jgi:Holliday junction resolvase
MTKRKRDLFDGAVPASEYYRAPTNKVTLKSVTESRRGYRIQVPKCERREVREQVIQAEIIHLLKARGAWVHKAKAVNLVGSGDGMALASTDRGVPDILCCYDGNFLAFEVKAAVQGKAVSGDQVAQIESIIEAGGVAQVVWSVEQVEAILDAMDELVLTAI